MSDVQVLTFGCRLNAWESEVMRARAAADGLTDTVVINTCAVTGEAVRQARQAIRRAHRERPGATILVTGCAAEIEPEAFAALPGVDRVIPNRDKTALGAPERTDDRLVDGLRDHARAWVEIQNGCDHSCTFCVIPQGRGASRSIPAGEVVARVRRLAEAGVNEVVLTGVDLTSWGADLPGEPTLGQLVARILRLVPALPRLRLSSVDAAEIDPDLLRCFAEEPRLAPYLHLSLQHGDDLMLKRMKRRHSRADALALVAAVRRARPDTAFGADLIAGFPTEDEAAFDRLVSLVDEAGLSYLHVFPFSPRPGTPAARMPQLPRELVKARAARLREAGAAALSRHLDSRMGTTVEVLVERGGRARAPDFTEVVHDGAAPVGAIVPLRLADHDGRRARGISPGPSPA